MRGRPGAAGRRGISLLVILVSLLLIGLAAGLAIPAWYARHEVTLDNAASGAAAQVDSGTAWATCTITSGTSAACTFASGSEPDVAPASNLRVVAAS